MEKAISGIRARTRDAAIRYRMGAGFAGDVNRTHPFAAAPSKMDETDPPTKYGEPVLLTAAGKIRHVLAADADSVTELYGVCVRPFPIQQQTSTEQNAAAGFGQIQSLSGVVDTMRRGLVMIQLNAGVAAPVKGGAVFIWCAATSGDHIQGGYETAASSGNTAALDPAKYQYNGPADEGGITELSMNI